jgi:hypothetical protein
MTDPISMKDFRLVSALSNEELQPAFAQISEEIRKISDENASLYQKISENDTRIWCLIQVQDTIWNRMHPITHLEKEQ